MLISLIIIFISNFCVSNAIATQTIVINEGHTSKVSIAINNFAIEDKNIQDKQFDKKTSDFTDKIIGVIHNDLKNSYIFHSLLKDKAFIEEKIGISHIPSFASWQQIDVDLLLNGSIHIDKGKIHVNVILWDTILGNRMFSENFTTTTKEWRYLAHKISNKIYEKITGHKGYFTGRITYVAEDGPYLKRRKRIAIMDYDGANHEYLTDGSYLALTPRFDHKGERIMYLSYRDNIGHVYMIDLKTRKHSLVGNFPGMSFAPRFSHDGKKALMSIAKNGVTHIYEINLKTYKKTQLTTGRHINTSPDYSPDGKFIVFHSDRTGKRELFIMKHDSSNIRKISNSGSYAEPSWSPSNYIAFTKISRENGGFTIGLMHVDDPTTERLITKGFLVESPSWVNGRIIVFTKGTLPRKHNVKNLHKIYIIDFTGHNEMLINTPHDASDPSWFNRD